MSVSGGLLLVGGVPHNIVEIAVLAVLVPM